MENIILRMEICNKLLNNHNRFRGIFEKGRKINGIETYHDGNSYEGEFMNSSQHG